MPTALKIIRQSSFTATPWRNGGGITYEAMRVPPGGDPFLWRVSVAHIDSSGPFSDFAGYSRSMVLLRGAGLTLKFGNGEQRVLQKIGDSAAFDGAMPTQCELLQGPCVDLNFMSSKSLRADARIVRLDQGPTALSAPDSALIFSLEAPLLLDGDAGDAGDAVRLEPWDLAVFSQGTVRLRRIEADRLSAPSAVFFATISH
ncbi:MAG TPA: HutD family protein [Steroidobacteraceae bacterium]|nr:HutD family protein [Steroidobacteraceae bacterium]